MMRSFVEEGCGQKKTGQENEPWTCESRYLESSAQVWSTYVVLLGRQVALGSSTERGADYSGAILGCCSVHLLNCESAIDF